MKQARVLTDAEMKRVLAVVAAGRHAGRNRLALMLSHLAGMRVGEIAALTIGDVVDGRGEVRDQLRLIPYRTKGRQLPSSEKHALRCCCSPARRHIV